jgi:rhamnogalacturonyl hydrolase YesR
MLKTIVESLNRLKDYCEAENFIGWDPYDGLNSKVFQAMPGIRNSKFCRLAWIQTFKRNPVNLRKPFLISKDFNPKGLGLFLNGYCNLYQIEPKEEYLEHIKILSNKVLDLKTQGYSGNCWGYNFDWESRAFFQPKYTPTIVASVFIGYALFDAYEILKDEKILQEALSISDFILKDLNRTFDTKGNFSFSYSPLDASQVFNATLLGSRLLARTYHYTKDTSLLVEAKKSIDFCIDFQKQDGSWSYGTLPFHQWIDNFHTGYNLECLAEYQKYSGDNSYLINIDNGFKYYIDTFFLDDGKCKYYNNSLYPIDIHAPAQLIITLSRLNKLNQYNILADKVLKWAIEHMQSEHGYYYYQINKTFTSKIPYMRWAQSWMFYALSTYLLANKNK